MTYATLAFSRVRFQAVKVKVDGQSRLLNEAQARAHFERTSPDWQRYTRRIEEQRARRRALEESASVRRNVQVRRETGGFRKSRVLVDLVEIDDHLHEVEAGAADSFVHEYAERKYPELTDRIVDPFVPWFESRRVEARTWAGELITATSTTPVKLDLKPQAGGSPADFPVALALRELDRLQEQGWSLVQASEDHEQYVGSATLTEACLVRVRYLLSRP